MRPKRRRMCGSDAEMAAAKCAEWETEEGKEQGEWSGYSGAEVVVKVMPVM
jgi:hypothetical protein